MRWILRSMRCAKRMMGGSWGHVASHKTGKRVSIRKLYRVMTMMVVSNGKAINGDEREGGEWRTGKRLRRCEEMANNGPHNRHTDAKDDQHGQRSAWSFTRFLPSNFPLIPVPSFSNPDCTSDKSRQRDRPMAETKKNVWRADGMEDRGRYEAVLDGDLGVGAAL